MLTVAHTTIGAAIGSFIVDTPSGNVLALGLGVASHYILDSIPHWENWFGREIYGFPSDTPLQKFPKITIISGLFDFIIAVTLFVFVYRNVGSGPFYQSSLFWGAFGGFLPDLLDNVPLISNVAIRLPGVKRERAFHEQVHISRADQTKAPYLAGLATQLIAIAFGLYLIMQWSTL